MTPEGTGYLQQKFSTFCPKRCGIKKITKETLGLRKISADLVSGPDSFLAWVAPQNSLPVFSHFWSRGTLFNPSSPSAAVIGSDIKSKICKRAGVYTRSQLGLINENSVVNIMRFAEYSLSTLKGRILTSQAGPSRRLCVYKLNYLWFVCLSLSQRTSRILSAYVDDKAYSVELAGAVSSKRNSSYSFYLIVLY